MPDMISPPSYHDHDPTTFDDRTDTITVAAATPRAIALSLPVLQLAMLTSICRVCHPSTML